jgi:dolichol-phosphate mannosyltransferase
MDKIASPEFSIVIPVYNEEENIRELYRRITPVMEKTCSEEGIPKDGYEVIMVDDGSTDQSWQIMKELHEKDQRLKGISFSRNFGHHNAVFAGLDHVQGNYIILMDGDLQDQPEEIPKLLKKSKDGYDIVQGIVSKRHANPLQNLFSRMFHRLFVKVSTVDPRTRIGLFRCLTKPVVESIKSLPERAVFFGGIVSWVGFNTAHIPVERAARHAGKSKYNFLKRFALAMNAITSFSERPLIFIFQLGVLVFVFSLAMFGYAVFRKIFYNVAIMGWTSLFASIFFSTGLITSSLSIIGLYISKLFIEIKQRPRYIIREKRV